MNPEEISVIIEQKEYRVNKSNLLQYWTKYTNDTKFIASKDQTLTLNLDIPMQKLDPARDMFICASNSEKGTQSLDSVDIGTIITLETLCDVVGFTTFRRFLRLTVTRSRPERVIGYIKQKYAANPSENFDELEDCILRSIDPETARSALIQRLIGLPMDIFMRILRKGYQRKIPGYNQGCFWRIAAQIEQNSSLASELKCQILALIGLDHCSDEWLIDNIDFITSLRRSGALSAEKVYSRIKNLKVKPIPPGRWKPPARNCSENDCIVDNWYVININGKEVCKRIWRDVSVPDGFDCVNRATHLCIPKATDIKMIGHGDHRCRMELTFPYRICEYRLSDLLLPKNSHMLTPTLKSICAYVIAAAMARAESQRVYHAGLSPQCIYFGPGMMPLVDNFRLITDGEEPRTPNVWEIMSEEPKIETTEEEGEEDYDDPWEEENLAAAKLCSNVFQYGAILYMLSAPEFQVFHISLITSVVSWSGYSCTEALGQLISKCCSGTAVGRPTFSNIVTTLRQDVNLWAFPGTDMRELRKCIRSL